MSEYTAVITWARGGATFTDNKYSRGHRWSFDGGIEVAASASPHVVPLPLSVAAAVDPEEAFVAALASCHMLWFLSIAAKRGFVVESYRDEAAGVLSKNAAGRVAMTKVTLHPAVAFTGKSRPTPAQHQEWAEKAASSVSDLWAYVSFRLESEQRELEQDATERSIHRPS